MGMSKFKKKLKEFLWDEYTEKGYDNFEEGWEMYCGISKLEDLPNHPTAKQLFERLTEKGKEEYLKDCQQLSFELDDEAQDFENYEIEEFTNEHLLLMAGGDWQCPANIRYELVNGELTVTDFYFCGYEKNDIKISEIIANFPVEKEKDEEEHDPEEQMLFLKRNMKYALENEDFLKAAEYRDEIKRLEDSLKK